ncbi:MAG: Wzt carbohydrate-binding domain-containing protein, partial [Vicinamibacteria bacterium]|nr:Wzt carbohydrate-binding domain-containing protein [Vicinamibacteria bacterium]
RGDPKRIIDAYLTYVAGGEETLLARERREGVTADGANGAPGKEGEDREGRWGNREIEITRVRLLDARGRERHVYATGESLTIELLVRTRDEVKDFVFGVGIFTSDGVSVYGTNTHIEEYKARRIAGEGRVSLRIDDLRLVEGSYLLDVAAHSRDGTPYDYHRGLHSFRVKSRIKDVGVYRPRHEWSFDGGIALRAPKARPELNLLKAGVERGE